MYEDLFIRTQYDGHDYRSVLEIYHYDTDGEEVVLADLTSMCMDISTCADQGYDTWSWIKESVENRLKHAGISYSSVNFCEDEPSMSS
ncbi:hypothetical protein BBM40_16130 [Vibrio parahaemolyticus]|uniref:hypothetical protein n=1 Tax=Vibrio harveyi group TaxID=717610 RepID=UPI00071FC581|nr:MULTISPECIES: hypothetical protein [Vibrio harveyi group]ALR91153.1 hypothetical protein AT730_01655 [Vibrio alginolyticus]MBY7707818.1 hypothetical protein [Vibrio alginolyticus]ODZ47869.1 hypothetical protein BBM40_16130 [Vibrio parahaemolyticus]HCG7966434.1 hypothetical protein [Vibrio parahaemolyticus]